MIVVKGGFAVVFGFDSVEDPDLCKVQPVVFERIEEDPVIIIRVHGNARRTDGASFIVTDHHHGFAVRGLEIGGVGGVNRQRLAAGLVRARLCGGKVGVYDQGEGNECHGDDDCAFHNGELPFRVRDVRRTATTDGAGLGVKESSCRGGPGGRPAQPQGLPTAFLIN